MISLFFVNIHGLSAGVSMRRRRSPGAVWVVSQSLTERCWQQPCARRRAATANGSAANAFANATANALANAFAEGLAKGFAQGYARDLHLYKYKRSTRVRVYL